MINIRDEDKGRLERAIKLLRMGGAMNKFVARDELTIVLAHIEELSQERPYPPPMVVEVTK